MEEEEYNRIYKNIEKEVKYVVKDHVLYRKEENKLLKVIRKYEFEGLMYIMNYQDILE